MPKFDIGIKRIGEELRRMRRKVKAVFVLVRKAYRKGGRKSLYNFLQFFYPNRAINCTGFCDPPSCTLFVREQTQPKSALVDNG